jgi:carbon storage regulator
MLVIPRKINEQIVLYDNIFVTVVDIRGDKVRLGIEHPPEMTVHRKEVYDAIQCENAKYAQQQSAAQAATAGTTPLTDKLAQLAAALARRLGVAVSRDEVSQSMRDAGIGPPEGT